MDTYSFFFNVLQKIMQNFWKWVIEKFDALWEQMFYSISEQIHDTGKLDMEKKICPREQNKKKGP